MPRDSHHRPFVQKNTARSRQYFPYAVARHASPERDNAAVIAPTAAKYTALISVAYVRNDGNAASYDLASPRKPNKDDRRRARSAARILAAGRAGVDVYAARQSRSTPSASGRHPGKAGGTGMLCRGSDVIQAKEETHLLMRIGAMF